MFIPSKLYSVDYRVFMISSSGTSPPMTPYAVSISSNHLRCLRLLLQFSDVIVLLRDWTAREAVCAYCSWHHWCRSIIFIQNQSFGLLFPRLTIFLFRASHRLYVGFPVQDTSNYLTWICPILTRFQRGYRSVFAFSRLSFYPKINSRLWNLLSLYWVLPNLLLPHFPLKPNKNWTGKHTHTDKLLEWRIGSQETGVHSHSFADAVSPACRVERASTRGSGRVRISAARASSSYPFMAAARLDTNCSGVVVTDRHVLTAAHCVLSRGKVRKSKWMGLFRYDRGLHQNH